eukprot:13016069-Heterocapsa_arctica.AAC.1
MACPIFPKCSRFGFAASSLIPNCCRSCVAESSAFFAAFSVPRQAAWYSSASFVSSCALAKAAW